MKKYLIGVLLLALVAGSAYYFKNRCSEPLPEQLVQAKVRCYMNTLFIAQNSSKEDICLNLKRDADCTLSEEDRPLIEKYFKGLYDKCIISTLERDNLCTDKLEL